jgi:hypothetical protein
MVWGLPVPHWCGTIRPWSSAVLGELVVVASALGNRADCFSVLFARVSTADAALATGVDPARGLHLGRS